MTDPITHPPLSHGGDLHSAAYNEECPICVEDIEHGVRFVTSNCRHGYHVECFQAYATHGYERCAVCQSVLPLCDFIQAYDVARAAKQGRNSKTADSDEEESEDDEAERFLGNHLLHPAVQRQSMYWCFHCYYPTRRMEPLSRAELELLRSVGAVHANATTLPFLWIRRPCRMILQVLFFIFLGDIILTAAHGLLWLIVKN